MSVSYNKRKAKAQAFLRGYCGAGGTGAVSATLATSGCGFCFLRINIFAATTGSQPMRIGKVAGKALTGKEAANSGF